MSRMIVSAAQILADPRLHEHDEKINGRIGPDTENHLIARCTKTERYRLDAHALDVALAHDWPVCPALLRRARREQVAA